MVQSASVSADPSVATTPGWQHPLPGRLHKPVLGLFVGWLAVSSVALALRLPWPVDLPWLDALLWPLAAATLLVGLARRLPLQNVVVTALLAGGIGLAVHWIGGVTDVPFGRRESSGLMGDRLLRHVPWGLPFVWITLAIACRGVARLILRPWRKLTYYGFWVMGVAALLSLLTALAPEPFAHARAWWVWETPRGVWAWHTAPWVDFLGWLLTTLAIYGFTTPWLLNKQPVKQPTDWHPLLVWGLLSAFLTLGNALAGAWDAVVLVSVGAGYAVHRAVQGGRW